MTDEYNEDLLEPLKYYNENLKDTFQQVTEHFFSALVEESNIDIEKNKSLMAHYTSVSENRDAEYSKYNRFRFARVVDIVVGVGAVLYGVYQFLQNEVALLPIIVCVALVIGALGIYLYIIKPSIDNLTSILHDLDATLESMRQDGYEMMKPLHDLFHSEMTVELIRKSIPFIHVDKNFNIERYEQLVKEYGFLEHDDEHRSTLDIASGDILGNPFVFLKRLIHWMGDYTYQGSRVVTYTEYYRDSDGNERSRQVSETLHAEIQQPGPYYNHRVTLIYGNHGAPNLTFHRKPLEKGLFSWGGTKNNVKNKISALRKKTKESIQEGGTFQGLANEEFDAQFNALDRDNEVEFRLLFTPLAQRNYQDIFESSPYGDDFIFNKLREINEVEAENSQQWDFDTTPAQYYHFSYEAIRNKFIQFNCNYFEHMYFSFLPLLAIPLYQQLRSEDYIYGKSYDFRYNDYMTEMLANKMQIGLFVPPDADRRDNVKTMLKTSHHTKDGESEIVKVEAHSYRTESHISYVPVRAGNGSYYDVPVEWEEYIPVSREELIEVAEIQSAGSNFSTIKGLHQYAQSEDNRDGSFAYGNFMASKLYKDNQSLATILQTIYKQYGGSIHG